VAAFPIPPDVEKTKGVKLPCFTSRTLSSYVRRFSCSCLQYAAVKVEDVLEGAKELKTLTS